MKRKGMDLVSVNSGLGGTVRGVGHVTLRFENLSSSKAITVWVAHPAVYHSASICLKEP